MHHIYTYIIIIYAYHSTEKHTYRAYYNANKYI